MAAKMKQIGQKNYTEDRIDRDGNTISVTIEEMAFQREDSNLIHLTKNCTDENGKFWQENVTVNNWHKEESGLPDDAEALGGKSEVFIGDNEDQSGKGNPDQQVEQTEKGKDNSHKAADDYCPNCDSLLSQSDIDNGECFECKADLSNSKKEEDDGCYSCGESLTQREIEQGHCDNCGAPINQGKGQQGKGQQGKGKGDGDGEGENDGDGEGENESGDGEKEGEGEGEGESCGPPPEPVFTSFEKYIMLLVLADPKRWTQYAYARNAEGLSLEKGNTSKVAAVSIDAAMDKIFNESRHNILSKNLKQHFDSLFKKNRKNQDLQKVNDSLSSHKDLIHLLCMLPVVDQENNGIFPVDEKMDQQTYLDLIEKYKNATLDGYTQQVKNLNNDSSSSSDISSFWSGAKLN